jgi:hypothetical protein
MDAAINIAFGVFMAGLGLITIYQAARLAALQTRRCRLNLTLLRLPIPFSSFTDYQTLVFHGDQSTLPDVEMNANSDADSGMIETSADAPTVEEERRQDIEQ